MEQGKCRSCGAAILWVRTEANNHLMPLDAEPDPEGNVIIRGGKAVVLGNDLFSEAFDSPRYMPHHATCPFAAKHRKKK